MGKLTITGKAATICEYDRISITVRFQVQANKSSMAISSVMDQCEKFLTFLEDKGVDLKDVHAGDNSVEQEFDDGLESVATREIVIDLPFNMKYVNGLLEEIKNQNYDIDIDTHYSLSNKAEIHKQLIKEAIQDSKEKAELIAKEVGQKVIGIKSADTSDRWCEHEREVGSMDFLQFRGSSYSRSDKISGAITEETEDVDVTWLISD